MAKIDWRTLTEDTLVWGFAYATTNTEKSMSLKRTPVKGMIKVYNNVGYRLTTKEFHELRKDGTPKAAYVSCYARDYTDNEEEAIECYNALIESQIDMLFGLIENHAKDIIVVSDKECVVVEPVGGCATCKYLSVPVMQEPCFGCSSYDRYSDIEGGK